MKWAYVLEAQLSRKHPQEDATRWKGGHFLTVRFMRFREFCKVTNFARRLSLPWGVAFAKLPTLSVWFAAPHGAANDWNIPCSRDGSPRHHEHGLRSPTDMSVAHCLLTICCLLGWVSVLKHADFIDSKSFFVHRAAWTCLNHELLMFMFCPHIHLQNLHRMTGRMLRQTDTSALLQGLRMLSCCLFDLNVAWLRPGSRAPLHKTAKPFPLSPLPIDQNMTT